MSRFEDTLQRDLTVIADRATPSPDAWQQIQTRIDDQGPIQETEIIMLTENTTTTTTRRWPLLAAAAAVAAVAIGAVVLVNRDDGANDPADNPTPQPTVLPSPDDAVEPDVDIPAGALRTVTLSAATERSFVESADAEQPEIGTWESTAVVAADGIRFDSVSSGEYVAQSDLVIDGTSRTVMTGSIDGIGSGSITVEGEWSRRNGTDNSNNPITDGSGAFEDATGTLRSTTDVATDRGTWTIELTLPADQFTSDFVEPVTAADPATEPSDAPTELVSGEPAPAGMYTSDALGTKVIFEVAEAMDGTWQTVTSPGTIWLFTGDNDEFVQMTRVGGWYDAAEAADPATVGLGSIGFDDVDGFIEARDDLDLAEIGTVAVDGRATRLIEFGMNPSSDAGEGICEPDERPCTWFVARSADAPGPNDGRGDALLGNRLVRAWVIDMDGFEPILIEGSTTRDDEAAWLDEVLDPIVDSIAIGMPTYTVPGGTARVPEQFTATGAFEAVRTTGEALADGSLPVTTTMTVDGAVAGDIAGIGTASILEAGVGEEGQDELTFTGTIDGVGTGTVTYMLDWQLVDGIYSSTGLITDGTGDFAGATGTTTTSIRTIGGDGAEAAGTVTFFLGLPASG